MNRPFVLVVRRGCLAVPLFAGNVVDHNLKVATKDSVNVAKETAKDTVNSGTHRQLSLLTAVGETINSYS
jgi:hypothetical protein